MCRFQKGWVEMDKLSLFAQMLKGNDRPLDEVEVSWDERAEVFYYNQVHGSTHYARAVPELLVEKGIVTPSSRVLDIGAGSGRYAIPLAKRSKSVQALDVSSVMLGFLEEEVGRHQLDNVYSVQSAWPVSGAVIGQVDVAFAAMCPATRSVEALKKMSEVAQEYGVICQFTASSDSVVDALKEQGLIEGDVKGPHNDRDLLQAYFNVLWELGYSPDVTYLDDTFVHEMSMEEAIESYRKRYEALGLEALTNVLDTLGADGGVLKIVKKRTLGVLSWRTRFA